ncbi:unnamed protein product [Penicillium salamii]|nr:unnamed protein product [Penicillium salamii]CAG8390289.1 unnamed protein product [Penicillium salamii]
MFHADHLAGIRLVDQNSYWQSELTKDSELYLRSFVNPALIPLHARSGPNLELHTSHAETSQWLQGKLAGTIWLDEEDQDLQQSIQCPVGLLLSIDSSKSSATTNLLVYGVLSHASYPRPPTPPHSSPFDIQSQPAPRAHYDLRIYAVPLSTTRLTQAQSHPSPPPDEDNPARCAEFLPDTNSPSPKRKRVATLFEVAAQHHRRVRQRGGEAVSQLMAPSRPTSSHQQSLRIKREPDDDLPSLSSLDRFSSNRSRSTSLSANIHRPGSVRGRTTPANVDPQKRAPTPNPFLERRTQSFAQTPSALSNEKPVSTPSSPNKDPEVVIAENKNLITRTILTCMRLYGFNRANMRTTSGSKGAEPDDGSGATPAPELRAETPAPLTDDDEFKSMYHATYKAAAFALRKYLKLPGAPVVLEKEKAMTCIDELLKIFCEDH